MGLSRHVLRAMVLAGLLATAMSSCQGQDCSLIGAESGVLVTFDEVKKLHPDERLTAEACADDECTTQQVGERQNATGLTLLAGKLHDATPVEITLRVTGDDGSTLFDGAATVTPFEFQPNGDGCEPTVWSVHVETVGTSELREREFSED